MLIRGNRFVRSIKLIDHDPSVEGPCADITITKRQDDDGMSTRLAAISSCAIHAGFQQ